MIKDMEYQINSDNAIVKLLYSAKLNKKSMKMQEKN